MVAKFKLNLIVGFTILAITVWLIWAHRLWEWTGSLLFLGAIVLIVRALLVKEKKPARLLEFSIKSLIVSYVVTSVFWFINLTINSPWYYSYLNAELLMNILIFDILPLALLPAAVAVILYGIFRIRLKAWEFFLVGYLKDVVQLDAFQIGIIMGSQVIAVILAKPFMGRLSDTIGRRTPIIAGSIVSGFPLLIMPFSTQSILLLLLSITYGLGFAMVTSSPIALVSELAPGTLTGTAMGVLGMTMDIGQTIGPLITGIVLATNLSYQGSFPAITIVLLVSVAVFALFRVAKAK